MNNLTFVNNLRDLIKEKYNIDISNLNEKYKEINIMDNLNIPLDLLEKYQITQFLRKQSLITTEDFFSFKEDISLNEITNEYKFKDIFISFVGLRLYQQEKDLKEANEILLQHLTSAKRFLVLYLL